jgi:hypothetical protein
MVTMQRIGPMSRSGLACVLVVAVASAPPSVWAAGPGSAVPPAFAPAPDVALEVRVSQEIVEAAELQRWVDEEARRVLDGLPDEPEREGNLHLEIGGALYDYQVTITARRNGAPLGLPTQWRCECSNEELLGALRTALPELAGELELEEEPESLPAPAISSPVVVVEPERERRRLRVDLASVAGTTVVATGLAGIGVGVAMMEVAKMAPGRAWAGHHTRDLSQPGTLLVGAGIGVAALGFAIHLVRRGTSHPRRAGVAAVGPALDGAGQVSLTVNGRF